MAIERQQFSYSAPAIGDIATNPGALAAPTFAAAPVGGGLSALMGGAAGGPIAMVGGAILSHFASKNAARQQKKDEQRQARQRMNDQAYTASLEDWYKRRDKQDWRNAAGNYKQFSSVSSFAPEYKNAYTAAEVGAAPTSDGYIAGDKKKFTDMNNKAQTEAAAKTLSSYGGG